MFDQLYIQCLYSINFDVGEGGEVCEIFQWKGSLENIVNNGIDDFSEKEKVNIGEEIADVFIYSTRLSDICNIDLAYVVEQISSQPVIFERCLSNDFMAIPNTKRTSPTDSWNNFSFSDLDTFTSERNIVQLRSPRHIALAIQTHIGRICTLFGAKSEMDCEVGLKLWKPSEVSQLATLLGLICILLGYLAKQSRHTLPVCITEKFAKNDAKYPATLSKGSSAKYTKYVADKNAKAAAMKSWAFNLVLIAISTSLGYFLGSSRWRL